MRYASLRWAGILFPALVVGVFESVRHLYLEQLLPGMLGNIVAVLLVSGVTFFFFTRLFRAMDRLNSRLLREQKSHALLEERNRMAREMHDGLSQSIFFLNIKLKSADRHIELGMNAAARDDLGEAQEAMSELYGRVRQVIFDLRAPAVRDWSLADALEDALQEVEAHSNIVTSLRLNIADAALAGSAEAFQVYRIAQEAIFNAQRHANPTRIEVDFDVDEYGNCQVSVVDDGEGFDLSKAMDAPGHFGLSMIQERARVIGADLEILSSPGRGTQVRIRWSKGESEGKDEVRSIG